MRRLLFLIAVSCCACCPCRNLTLSTADSVRVETVVRTEFVKDTVYLEIPREVVREVVTDSSHLETNMAVSDAKILPDGRLYHLLENKSQKRPFEVQTRVEYRDSIMYRDRFVRQTVEVPRRFTDWQRFQMTAFWVFLTAFLAIIAWKIWRLFK